MPTRDICVYVDSDGVTIYCLFPDLNCSSCFVNCGEYKYRKLQRAMRGTKLKGTLIPNKQYDFNCDLCWQRFRCWTNG